MHFNEISHLLLSYYIAYRNIKITTNEIHKTITYITSVLEYNRELFFPTFTTIESIEIFEIPYDAIYFLNNDGFSWNDIQLKLIQHVNKHHHIIKNNDIVLSVNVVPFDGLELRHGDILNMLDPIYL